jgi:glycosyltransferase involved in cell wall biosynthesis
MGDNFPFVSICTPTYNRRPFIPSLIKSIEQQRYPKNKIEWIIVDDGPDSIEDLVKDIPFVKYVRYNTKITLGHKRNVMNSMAKGEYLVYFDDDDYYPPTRIYHAISTLMNNPTFLIAGSSELLIYYNHLREIWKFGSSGRYHSTAATFAFHRKLLNITKFNDKDESGEEKVFLKHYTIPLIQLNPIHTILVFSHLFNTFDKKILLKNGSNIRKTLYHPIHIIEGDQNKKFYLQDMTKLLKFYKFIFLQRLDYIKKNDTKSISNDTTNNNEYGENGECEDELRGEEIGNDSENTRDYIEPVK